MCYFGRNIQEYTSNILASNLWNQLDDDGYNYNVLYEIIGHEKNKDAITIDNRFYKTKTGVRRRVIAANEWVFRCVGTYEIPQTNPIEAGEFVIYNKLDHELAFARWFKSTLKRRGIIVSKKVIL